MIRPAISARIFRTTDFDFFTEMYAIPFFILRYIFRVWTSVQQLSLSFTLTGKYTPKVGRVLELWNSEERELL